MPASSHRGIHVASSPSSAGFSGSRTRAGSEIVSDESGTERSYYRTAAIGDSAVHQLLDRALDPVDFFSHEPLGDRRDDFGRGFADDAIGEPLEDAAGHLLDEIVGDG